MIIKVEESSILLSVEIFVVKFYLLMVIYRKNIFCSFNGFVF